MISDRPIELALEKQRLQFRCAAQRHELERGLVPLAPILVVAETVRNGAHWVREHPEITAGILVAIFVAKPRVVIRWTQRAWLVWKAWRKFGPAISKAQRAR